MHLTLKYGLQLNRTQHRALETICEAQRQFYNAALQERIDCYRKTGKGRNYIDQCKALTECRHHLPEMASFPVSLQRWTLKRLDDAYAAFFRRIKSGRKAGFPRFRSKSRWDSFGFNEKNGFRFDGKRLRFKGMPGGIRVHLHRPVTGEIKSCVFRCENRRWSVCFHVEIKVQAKCPTSPSVGIDLGLSVFAHQSDGIIIPNPRFSRRTERAMRLRQRSLARCRRGSGRRKKIKARLQGAHRKIANQRTTWLHQQSALICRSYNLIAAEDLHVANMVRNRHVARSIIDAGWSTFLSMVAYKAERAGKHFVTVDPRNTSQKCSGCGELVPKPLAVRTHSCPHCGLVIDRDYNAALNILAAVMGRREHNVIHQDVRALGNLTLEKARHYPVGSEPETNPLEIPAALRRTRENAA